MDARRVPIRFTGLLIGVGALMVAGCSTARPGARPGGVSDAERVTFRIQNDLVVPSSVSVFIVTEDGDRQLLGQVPADTARTLVFRPRFHSLEHQLLAETETGRRIASNPFTLAGTTHVTWRLQANYLEVAAASLRPDFRASGWSGRESASAPR